MGYTLTYIVPVLMFLVPPYLLSLLTNYLVLKLIVFLVNDIEYEWSLEDDD